MRAAILREYGATPELGEFDDPVAGDGQVVADVLAAGLNPIDLRIASGTLAGRRPELPYIPGGEGIARLPDGRKIYFDRTVHPYGAFAERVLLEAGHGVEVPDGSRTRTPSATASPAWRRWLSLDRRGQLQPGETVLILGASGVVGLIGVQVAKLLGAGAVIGAARSGAGLRRAEERGADATVRLQGGVGDMAEAFRAAAPDGIELVMDPLWGEPAAAAIDALAFRGRLVQLGQSAGGEARLVSPRSGSRSSRSAGTRTSRRPSPSARRR